MALYAFDGTLNRRDEKAAIEAVQSPKWGANRAFGRDTTETNVHRFREFYGAKDTEYLQGVGTRFHLVGKAVGGIFGAGGHYRLRQMYLALCRRFKAGDTAIDIVGFSRGAALALHFAGVLNKYGAADPDDCHAGPYYYEGLGWTMGFPKLNAARKKTEASIRFLGLWDTVGTFGVPLKPFRNRLKQWWLTDIPPNVKRSFHAMALDEVRTTYELVRPAPARPDQHYEVWFRGVHSNIGGSYPDRGLSDIALAWMMEMFLWTLQFDKPRGTPPDDFLRALRMIGPERLAPPKEWISTGFESLEPDADGELGVEPAVRRQAWREVPPDALFHHSVHRRAANLISDYYRANRRLLRRLPGDARPVYDPPFFYDETPEQAIERIAREAFGNIPVRQAEWFVVDTVYPVRGDDWLAPAPELTTPREDLRGDVSLDAFLTVAMAWLQAGKPDAGALKLTKPLTAYGGGVIQDAPAVTAWIVDVLRALERHVPALRTFQPYRPAAPPTHGGDDAPEADDRRRHRRPDPE